MSIQPPAAPCAGLGNTKVPTPPVAQPASPAWVVSSTTTAKTSPSMIPERIAKRVPKVTKSKMAKTPAKCVVGATTKIKEMSPTSRAKPAPPTRTNPIKEEKRWRTINFQIASIALLENLRQWGAVCATRVPPESNLLVRGAKYVVPGNSVRAIPIPRAPSAQKVFTNPNQIPPTACHACPANFKCCRGKRCAIHAPPTRRATVPMPRFALTVSLVQSRYKAVLNAPSAVRVKQALV